jgi:hypothetical protein
LHAARDYWASQSDNQQLAHIDFSLARMEGLRGKKKPALGYLDSAQEHCEQLPPEMEYRGAQIERISELRHIIETGGDISAL